MTRLNIAFQGATESIDLHGVPWADLCEVAPDILRPVFGRDGAREIFSNMLGFILQGEGFRMGAMQSVHGPILLEVLP